jgi:hypothetical protein
MCTASSESRKGALRATVFCAGPIRTANMMERGKYEERTTYVRTMATRAILGALALIVALFIPPAIVPLGVRAGTLCDVLVAASQVVFGIVLDVAITRTRFPARSILLVTLAVGAYWAVVRLGVDFLVLLGAGGGGAFWLVTAAAHPHWRLECRGARTVDELKQEAKRAFRALVLLVCAAAIECLIILHPGAHELPAALYAILLPTVVGALVAYMHCRLALLEMALSKTPFGSSGKEQQSEQTPSHEGGVDAEGATGRSEEN